MKTQQSSHQKCLWTKVIYKSSRIGGFLSLVQRRRICSLITGCSVKFSSIDASLLLM